MLYVRPTNTRFNGSSQQFATNSIKKKSTWKYLKILEPAEGPVVTYLSARGRAQQGSKWALLPRYYRVIPLFRKSWDVGFHLKFDNVLVLCPWGFFFLINKNKGSGNKILHHSITEQSIYLSGVLSWQAFELFSMGLRASSSGKQIQSLCQTHETIDHSVYLFIYSFIYYLFVFLKPNA